MATGSPLKPTTQESSHGWKQVRPSVPGTGYVSSAMARDLSKSPAAMAWMYSGAFVRAGQAYVHGLVLQSMQRMASAMASLRV